MKTLKNIQLVNIEGGRELVKPCRGYLIIPFPQLGFGFFLTVWFQETLCRVGGWRFTPSPPSPLPIEIEGIQKGLV